MISMNMVDRQKKKERRAENFLSFTNYQKDKRLSCGKRYQILCGACMFACAAQLHLQNLHHFCVQWVAFFPPKETRISTTIWTYYLPAVILAQFFAWILFFLSFLIGATFVLFRVFFSSYFHSMPHTLEYWSKFVYFCVFYDWLKWAKAKNLGKKIIFSYIFSPNFFFFFFLFLRQ